MGEEIELTEQLQADKRKLQEKVKIGALLKPSVVDISGIRIKSSGKETATNSAKKSQKLKICFELEENKVSDAGNKTIFVRVISPEGSTIAVQSLGSGVITLTESGDQTQYTTKVNFDYKQEATRQCVYWSQNFPFSKGTYQAKLYQSGYEIGDSEFSLK